MYIIPYILSILQERDFLLEFHQERRAYRVVGFDCVAESFRRGSRPELAEAYRQAIEHKLAANRLVREARWCGSPAVGSEEHVREVAGKIGRRNRIEILPCAEEEGGA